MLQAKSCKNTSDLTIAVTSNYLTLVAQLIYNESFIKTLLLTIIAILLKYHKPISWAIYCLS